MDIYYTTIDAPLEEKERKKLKLGLIILPIFTVIFGLIFYFLLHDRTAGELDFWIISGFGVFFLAIILSILRGLLLDLSDGTKQIFKGLITRKEETKIKARKRSSSKSYFFLFGDKRITVELKVYNEFREGDLIEIHKSKRLKMIYKTQLLKRGVMLDEIKLLKQNQLKKENRMGLVFFVIMLFIVVMVWLGINLDFIL